MTYGQVHGWQVEWRGLAQVGGGVMVVVVGRTHSGRNVITRDLLSMSSELPLDCESDYRGV